MTLTEAHEELDTFEPGNITPADYPRLSRCLIAVREDRCLPTSQRRLVCEVLRELYRYCELTGQDWTVWVE